MSANACAPHREVTNVSKVKVVENGKSAVFLNPKKKKFFITRVDGGVVKHELAADYVVTQHEVGSLIVELKGKEVGRAVEQVVATAELLKKCSGSLGTQKVSALVVCTRVPRQDSRSLRLQNAFQQKHRARLRIVASNVEHNFAALFGA
ncbi:hypothetical protein [Xanthomonas maliensis]|uniref:hypothetical protein n=1 Tax=Xanthomonas maliensis TaxID=1321368 RepID=UPI001264D58D|nr:hypothetical protein [Xanthomonas maliensis]